MKKCFIASAVFSVWISGSVHAATEINASIQKHLESSTSVLVGTVEGRGNARHREIVLSNVNSISRNGRQLLSDVVPLRSARVDHTGEKNLQRPNQVGNGVEQRIVTRMNEALPNFSLDTKYLIFMSESGEYSSGSTFLVNPDETVSTLDGTPIVIDEKTQLLRRAKFEFDLSGVEERLLRDSDSGNDRILYYSRAQINYKERPSPLNAIVEVITARMASDR